MMDYDDDIVWVCGGVDAYGHVVAHIARHSEFNLEHTAEESALTSWRWSVSEQMFMDPFIPQKRHMTDDEVHAVWNWLEKRGLKKVKGE